MKRISMHLTVLLLLVTACSGVPSDSEPIFIDTGIDPDTWATVPAGEFLMGLHEHETQVEYTYEIMVTSVTNAQFAFFKAMLKTKKRIFCSRGPSGMRRRMLGQE